MTALRQLVELAVDAVDVDGGRVLWRGQCLPSPPAGVLAHVDAATVRTDTVARLASCLYLGLYRPGVGRAHDPATLSPGGRSADSFAASLAAANRGGGRWISGATVLSAHPVRAVRWRGIEARCSEGDVRTSQGDSPAPGDTVAVFRPAHSRTANRGYVTMVWGETDDGAPGGPRARFYWNVHPRAAARLVGELTEVLVRDAVAHTLKVPDDPAHYDRPDVAVLYVAGTDAARVRRALPPVWRRLQGGLHPAVPALTLRLADGLAFAEHRQHAESFGMDRMRRIAEALLAAHDARVSTRGRRTAFVLDALGAAGVDAERPYLAPGSATLMLPLSPAECGTPRGPRHAGAAAPGHELDPGAVALAMSRRIAAVAVRSAGRCTWLSADSAGNRTRGSRLRTLGPALYDGTAGIAITLAEVGAHLGDSRVCDTAAAGITHALDAAGVLPHDLVGMYTGRAGIGLAAMRVGRTLGRGDIVEQGVALLAELTAMTALEPDLSSGLAGLCLAMLVLERETAEESHLAAAVAHGERLLTVAERTEQGWSWPSPSAPPGRERNLCGLSHGAAGVAHALSELGERTGDDRWRTAAAEARAYERHWFDPARANWPDFRDPSRRPASGFMVAWCHGSGGIVLERSHAATAHADPCALSDARAGVESVATWTAAAVGARVDFSLCHGVAGNCEALIAAGAVLEDGAHAALARRALSDGARRYELAGLPWPGGHRAGPTPSLMLGDAGIALVLLRWAEPSIPSVLIPSATSL